MKIKKTVTIDVRQLVESTEQEIGWQLDELYCGGYSYLERKKILREALIAFARELLGDEFQSW